MHRLIWKLDYLGNTIGELKMKKLGLGSIVVSTPCLRERVMKCLKRGQRKERIHAEKVKVVVENGGVEMTRKAEI